MENQREISANIQNNTLLRLIIKQKKIVVLHALIEPHILILNESMEMAK